MREIMIDGKKYQMFARAYDVERLNKKYDIKKVPEWPEGMYTEFVYESLFAFIKQRRFFKKFRKPIHIKKAIQQHELKSVEAPLVDLYLGEDKDSGNAPIPTK
jgi:hypothetical protein